MKNKSSYVNSIVLTTICTCEDTDRYNFLNKLTLVSQQHMFLVAKDSNILHKLNFSIYSPTIFLAIIWYTPSMIVPHKWTQIWCLALVTNKLATAH